MAQRRSPTVLPGFHLSLSYTLVYLTILLALPLPACFFKVATLSGAEFLSAVWTPRARYGYMVTFGTSLAAGVIDARLGLLRAGVIVRYNFFGKRIFDSLLDLPFALPTAVAELVYS